MTPYPEYCEWPATQRMRPARLARRVEFFSITGPEKPSLTGTNRTWRRQPPAGSRYRISLPISSMLKNCHEMFGFMPVDLPGIKPSACGAEFLF